MKSGETPTFILHDLERDLLQMGTPSPITPDSSQARIKSPLLDVRLERAVAEASERFECIVISHIPLARRGEDVFQEDNENRVWIKGLQKYSSCTNPSSSSVETFLRGYVCAIKHIYEKRSDAVGYKHGLSVLFHPYLFSDNELKGNAPLICQSTDEQIWNEWKLKSETPGPEDDLEYEADRGYQHTRRLETYRQANIEDIQSNVRNGLTLNKKSLPLDLQIRITEQHKIVRDFCCSQLFGPPKATPYASSFFACPTALLGASRHVAVDSKVATNIAGMFWLMVVGKGSIWRQDDQEAALALLRRTWLILLSDHLQQRAVADIRKGEVQGLSEASRQFAHQIKAVAFGVGTGWLVSPDRWRNVSEMFRINSQALPEPKIAMLPRLYEDLSKTLILWSMSYDLDELFERSVPSSLEDIILRAESFARANVFVQAFRTENFEADAVKITMAAQDGSVPKVRLSQACTIALRTIKVTDGAFRSPESGVDSTDFEVRCKQLSALLRAFVVVIENYLIHGEGELSIDAAVDSERLKITCTNRRAAKRNTSQSPRHLGYKGSELVRYICRTELSGDSVPSPTHSSSYWIELDIARPDWLVGRGMT
jgi:hypothetical protein